MYSNIDAERGRFKMSQEALANTLGVSCSTLKNWMSGKGEIPASALIKMTKIFDCTTDYLLGLSENRKNAS